MKNNDKNLTQNTTAQIQEKQVDGLTVAGIRTRGRYQECGPVFGKLGRKIGRHIAGKAMCLYYDGEYRETDADFEPCFPIGKRVDVDGIEVHELPSGSCLSLIHVGPYEELSRSYGALFEHARERGLEITLPTREIYLKGPGMAFKAIRRNT